VLRQTLSELGDPQRAFRSILVVGTNGKGSTAAMLEAVLAQSGLSTGLYTSPHLVRVEERIRIAGAPVEPSELERQLAKLDRYPDLTFFETLTGAAFLAFAEAGVDCAVLEAGMGGRWDATRAACSAVAGLTNVGSDHPAWLGADPEQRARDKGSALAAADRAVIGSQVESALVPHLEAPHARRASELVQTSPLAPTRVQACWDDQMVEIELPFRGGHQLHNLQLALALARCAEDLGWLERVDAGKVRVALEQVRWPGRLSTHCVLGRRVLVDCAHNVEGVAALADHLAGQSVLYHLLFSCLDDKPLEAMASTLRRHVGNVAVCPLADERAAPLERLKEAFPEAASAPSVVEALALLPAPVLVAGSVRLVGEVLACEDRRPAW
jgi:dihydrofolate synthase/folylpolyglutamate synthase